MRVSAVLFLVNGHVSPLPTPPHVVHPVSATHQRRSGGPLRRPGASSASILDLWRRDDAGMRLLCGATTPRSTQMAAIPGEEFNHAGGTWWSAAQGIAQAPERRLPRRRILRTDAPIRPHR